MFTEKVMNVYPLKHTADGSKVAATLHNPLTSALLTLDKTIA